jgi:hypothetical protein
MLLVEATATSQGRTGSAQYQVAGQ